MLPGDMLWACQWISVEGCHVLGPLIWSKLHSDKANTGIVLQENYLFALNLTNPDVFKALVL